MKFVKLCELCHKHIVCFARAEQLWFKI